MQFIFNLTKSFILIDKFEENEHYEINPNDTISIFIYYFFIFICIVNVIVNYFSFYWSNREIYNENKEKLLTNGEIIRITKFSKKPEFLEKIINEQGNNSNNESFYNFSYNKNYNNNGNDYESIESDLIFNDENNKNNLKRTFLEKKKNKREKKYEDNLFPTIESEEDEVPNKNKQKRKSTMDYENRNSLQ